MMPEVCNKVAIEPHLQPVTSEEISCLSTPRMVPYQQPGCASQHPGCLCQDGASQHPGWCLSTPRMVPLNTQDGALPATGACLSTPRMVPLNTQDGTSTSTQDGTSLDVAAELLGE